MAKLRQREAEILGGKNVKAERKKILFRLAARMLQSLGMISGILEKTAISYGFRSAVLIHTCNLKSSKELYK